MEEEGEGEAGQGDEQDWGGYGKLLKNRSFVDGERDCDGGSGNDDEVDEAESSEGFGDELFFLVFQKIYGCPGEPCHE